MSKNYLHSILENYKKAIPVIYSLFIAFISIRIFEYVTYNSNSVEKGIKISYLNGGILLDLIFSNCIVLLVVFFQSFFFFKIIKTRYFLNIFSLVIILLTAILSQIFLETSELLDEIFYQFTLDDIIKIGGGVEGVDYKIISVFSFFLLLYILSFSLLRNINFRKKSMFLFGAISIIAIVLSYNLNYKSNKHISFKLVNNKLVYFSIKSYGYFSDKSIEDNELTGIDTDFLAGKLINEEYPLMHEFENDEKFASLFNIKSKTPPNIVFIIVESLSTDFVGKYSDSTGHIMPFLDSLASKSIYFPNIISTAERTYNVLPAVLSSTPNAPKHERFMKLELPKHWSAFDLLRKNYFSRFYCGVQLEFDGMDNFLKYHEIDYTVNNWEKQFSPDFSPKNQWGFPDEQLFMKSIVDLEKRHKKIKKSRLDVFLTISTHHPYVIPNQKSVTLELKNDLQKNLKYSAFKKIALRRVNELSVYRYTDNSIRTFFNKMKKRSDFNNTIFMILGDHGSGLHIRNELSRAATPLIIYSKLIKKPREFTALSSHVDILPSILNLLKINYNIELPNQVPFIGKGLRLNPKNTLVQPISSFSLYNQFMIYKDYYLFHDQLYRIKQNLNLEQINDPKKTALLKNKLLNYNKLCNYTIYKDKIIPEKDFEQHFNSTIYKKVKSTFLSEMKTNDEFINFNTQYNLDSLKKSFKIEINFTYYLKKLKDIEMIPKLVISYNKGKKTINWLQYDARMSQSFTGEGWYKMKYVYVSDQKELDRLKNYSFVYYILNKEHKLFHAKKMIINTFIKH